MKLELTPKERQQILAADVKQITRPDKPDLPDRIVLHETQGRRYYDRATDRTFEVPSQPDAWIEKLKAVRTTKGYRITWELHDNRDPAQFPARHHGYTSDPSRAVDDHEAVLTPADRERLARQRTEGRLRHLEARRGRAEDELRRQEKAVRDELRATLRGLGPDAQVALIAGIQRLLRDGRGDNGEQAA